MIIGTPEARVGLWTFSDVGSISSAMAHRGHEAMHRVRMSVRADSDSLRGLSACRVVCVCGLWTRRFVSHRPDANVPQANCRRQGDVIYGIKNILAGIQRNLDRWRSGWR
jgi:hypothetical protein